MRCGHLIDASLLVLAYDCCMGTIGYATICVLSGGSMRFGYGSDMDRVDMENSYRMTPVMI